MVTDSRFHLSDFNGLLLLKNLTGTKKSSFRTNGVWN